MSPWETGGEPAAHSTPCFARSPPLPGTAGAGLFHWGSTRAGGSSTAGAQRRRKKDNRLLPQFHCSIKQEQPVKHAIRTHARKKTALLHEPVNINSPFKYLYIDTTAGREPAPKLLRLESRRQEFLLLLLTLSAQDITAQAQAASAARGLIPPFHRRLRALALVWKHYDFKQRVDDDSTSAVPYPAATTASSAPPEPAARAPCGAPRAKERAAGPPRDGTYREDSPLKLPPSSSRTLQKRMPLTNGTEESSSSSSSTRNLNFFFFIIMKAMGREPPGDRPHARSEPRGSAAPPPRSAPIPGATAAPRGRSAAPLRSRLGVLFSPRPRPAALTWQPAPPRRPRPPGAAPRSADAALATAGARLSPRPLLGPDGCGSSAALRKAVGALPDTERGDRAGAAGAARRRRAGASLAGAAPPRTWAPAGCRPARARLSADVQRAECGVFNNGL